jgi:phenylalanyl-tRNA synthetase beta subunit
VGPHRAGLREPAGNPAAAALRRRQGFPARPLRRPGPGNAGRAGLQEVRSHSLAAPTPLAAEDEIARRVLIRSALSPELSSLRTSLLPNLIEIAARAHAAGIRDIALFEVGPVYQKGEEGYREPLRVSGFLSGSAMPAAWAVKPDALPADFFFAKGVTEELLRVLGITGVRFAPGTHPITHPGRTATISTGLGLGRGEGGGGGGGKGG